MIRYLSNKSIFIMIGLGALLSSLINFPAIAGRDTGDGILIGSVHSVMEQSGTWEKGAEISCDTTTYDLKGNVTQTKTAFCEIDGTVKGKESTSTYQYNERGKLIKIESSFNDGSPPSVETIQDDGYIRIEAVHNLDGSLRNKRMYFYERGREVKEIFYNASGLVLSKVIYTYDKSGNLTQTISYKGDTSIDHKNVFAYDKNGNRTQATIYKSNNSIDYKATYTYDEKRHMTKSLINKYKTDGSLDEKQVTLYNEAGYLTETAIYNAEDSLQKKETYSYEFDSVGNWTKKTTSKWVMKDGKLSPGTPYIIKRTIAYY